MNQDNQPEATVAHTPAPMPVVNGPVDPAPVENKREIDPDRHQHLDAEGNVVDVDDPQPVDVPRHEEDTDEVDGDVSENDADFDTEETNTKGVNE